MRAKWREGNRIELLENGEEFFPRVFEEIAKARHEVLLETFILFEDKVGWALHKVLLEAAQRGVQVGVTVDGFGSLDLSEAFTGPLIAAGVRFHIFDHQPRVLGIRYNFFRRMHRKIVVVDGRIAFIGGINYSADHLGDYGPEAKQDYAVELEGPIVEDIHQFAAGNLRPAGWRRFWRPRRQALPSTDQRHAGSATVTLVTRDNVSHPTDIEQVYRLAIRSAKRELIIANAYFFPGYRFLRDLRKAAQRGLKVTLILQGEPDMPIAKYAARTLYQYLLGAGVHIYEYCERPLHGKVALADDEWATVGSSNLDPLSLSLNLEANVIVRDRAFNQELRQRLQRLIDNHCKHVEPSMVAPKGVWRLGLSFAVFHLSRWFPAWANWLPTHRPTLTTVAPPSDEKVPRAAQDVDTARGTEHTGALLHERHHA